MIKKVLYFYFFWTILGMYSCQLTDNEAPLIGYLDLKDPIVRLNNGVEDTHKITDIWVFENGQIVGVFPLPARVPLIISEGAKDILLLAGIRNNGQIDFPVFYPFYASIQKEIFLEPDQAINIPLIFTYIDDALFSINETFEAGNTLDFDLDADTESYLERTELDAALGLGSGRFVLPNSDNTMEIAGPIIREGRNQRGNSYVEFDYKGNQTLNVGIVSQQGANLNVNYKLIVPGRSEWNKIYVDFTEELSSAEIGDYRIVLRLTRSNGNTAEFFIDNFKHVHF